MYTGRAQTSLLFWMGSKSANPFPSRSGGYILGHFVYGRDPTRPPQDGAFFAAVGAGNVTPPSAMASPTPRPVETNRRV